jgi:adenosylhomocysteine nucleosidase
VGLRAEARIAARFGYPVLAGGGAPEGAAEAASRLAARGARALVSFGLAGGLDPSLRAGRLIIPSAVLAQTDRLSADPLIAERFGGLTGHLLLAGSAIASDAASKCHLRATTRADAIDLESGAVARTAVACGLPFVVVRAICDPADRDLPPAALIALDAAGGVGFRAVVRSVLRQPGQLPDLLALARDAMLARRALIQLARRFRPS